MTNKGELVKRGDTFALLRGPLTDPAHLKDLLDQKRQSVFFFVECEDDGELTPVSFEKSEGLQWPPPSIISEDFYRGRLWVESESGAHPVISQLDIRAIQTAGIDELEEVAIHVLKSIDPGLLLRPEIQVYLNADERAGGRYSPENGIFYPNDGSPDQKWTV